VDSREPRPFVNIERAVLRANDAGQAFNASERIDIHDALASYTINGAIALNQADIAGSIEVGKKADLAVLDQNLVKLAESESADQISETTVLLTVFDGKVVYRAPAFPSQ
ncbi:MAG: amidohydrolase family protein, partial [Woeseia sp.]